MADSKYYVCDGASVTARRKVHGAGAEVSTILGQEKCAKFAEKGIVSKEKPASLKKVEAAKAEAEKRAKARAEKAAKGSKKPAAKKAEKAEKTDK